jgi:S-adenosylmethionine synthetase
MFGYAVNETPSLMPAPILYSHQLGRAITKLRKSGKHTWLRPDSKTQVSMEYVDGKPVNPRHRRRRLDPARRQHRTAEIREILKKELIEAVIPGELLTEKTEYHINPTGLFIIGGPEGDCGLTGRKIIVDTYGGMGRHGGGAFSGKDPSKVDRSAAYMCRYVAKNVVAAGLADRCELQLAYAIGYPQPVSVHVDTFGTHHVDDAKIEKAIKEIFSFKPADFIKELNLLRPIYRKTTNYGHFGREDDTDSLTWEKTDKAEALKSACA